MHVCINNMTYPDVPDLPSRIHICAVDPTYPHVFILVL